MRQLQTIYGTVVLVIYLILVAILLMNLCECLRPYIDVPKVSEYTVVMLPHCSCPASPSI